MSSGMYEDAQGRLYRVLPGIGLNTYKARYRKPGAATWKCLPSVPWRDTRDAAQEDLDRVAHEKGWRPVPTEA